MRYDPKKEKRTQLAREELTKIANRLELVHGLDDEADWIRDIVGELMHRRSVRKPVARTKQAKITSAVVREVWQIFNQNPARHNREIGQMVGIDGGRVSEILHGQRTETYPQGTPEWKS